MDWKKRIAQFRRRLVSGELARQRPQQMQILYWVGQFALGMVLAAVPVLQGWGPFGVAVTAQAGGGVSGLMCAIGASLSYLAVLGLDSGGKAVAAVVLAFTASYVTQELPLRKSVYFLPSIAAAVTLVTEILGGLGPAPDRPMAFPVLLRTGLAFAGCYFFREALTPGPRETETAEKRHLLALTILLACILMALSDAEIAGVASIGRLASILTILVVAYKGGGPLGCAVGAVLGFAMDFAGQRPAFYAMAYALGGLMAGMFSRNGRLMSLISLILTGALAIICASDGGLRSELLYEELIAALIFLMLPGRLLSYAGSLLRPGAVDNGESGLRQYTARRVQQMADAFRDLYATVDATLGASRNDEDIASVFDRASEMVCGKCKNKSLCWMNDYVDTLSAFNDATPHIRARGLLAAEDLPAHFANACLHLDALVTTINGELRGRMYRQQFRRKSQENRGTAYGQYLHIAAVLDEVAEELKNAGGPDYLARRRLNRYLSGIDLEADVSVFRDRIGRLHILLESPKLSTLLKEPDYLDKLSGAVGVRLCRPGGADGAAEGRMTLLEAEPLSVSVGIASMKKKGEAVSGDRGTYFKTDQGVLCVILSDGMGSGEDAAVESVAAVRILERFLRAGVEPATAMRILNAMMLLKNGEVWGFATVDLVCIDLFTGEAAFYKYGAAPSYVRSARGVRRIPGETLAAGLSGGDTGPDVIRLRLRPGNLALIASDGVIAETNDEWLRGLLAEHSADEPKALAKETLQTALKQYGCGDDMTVLAMRVENRE